MDATVVLFLKKIKTKRNKLLLGGKYLNCCGDGNYVESDIGFN